MATTQLNEATLRRILKEVVVEVLEERRDVLHQIFSDVLEDYAIGEAIREGKKTKFVQRDEVVTALREKG